MNFLLVLIPTLCYAGTVASEWAKGDKQTALIFLGYTLANVGFLWRFWNG